LQGCEDCLIFLGSRKSGTEKQRSEHGVIYLGHYGAYRNTEKLCLPFILSVSIFVVVAKQSAKSSLFLFSLFFPWVLEDENILRDLSPLFSLRVILVLRRSSIKLIKWLASASHPPKP
jgi:hypothetical protein